MNAAPRAGLPLIFSARQKCLKVLDDGRYNEYGNDPTSRYNFGMSAHLLFKPCDPAKAECAIGPDGLPSLDPIIRLKPYTSQPDIDENQDDTSDGNQQSLADYAFSAASL